MHYNPCVVCIKHINIRSFKSLLQHKHTQQSFLKIDANRFKKQSLLCIALTPVAEKQEKGFIFTLRNLWSKKANQFVSIFSATDSVLQDKKGASSFVTKGHPTESQSALITFL